MGDEAILQVRNLTTRLQLKGKTATIVDEVSFDLFPGKTLAVVGESGCGKSMMALSLLGIVPTPRVLWPEGEVLFHSENLLSKSESQMRQIRGKKIAMIFQDPMTALNPVYTIGNQLEEVVNLHLGLYGDEAHARMVEVLEDVGIPSPEQRLKEYPHQLSGGMKQRAMIAMAMLCEPEILIADEPTTALDVTIQAQVLELMQRLQEEHGTALLLITHDMGVVAEMADEVMVMYASQVMEKGSVYDLFDHMAHPYTQGLFRSLPGQGQGQAKLPVIEGSVPPVGQFPQGCYFHPRCPHVMDRCRQGEVSVGKGEGNRHEVKCWLYSK